ncbi:hypothetical protein GCM10009716_42640 [Streptomyces sodiiphilus]|uniref:Uncharacterized protein n=1 Tax=Streptomyces sodiiphilus TaxID=226217 RepID=A0ABN2PSS5_9ACTN
MNQLPAAAVSARNDDADPVERTEDPAGRITLSGRNKACARTRALAGMVLTSGIVVTLSSLDTSVSGPHGV